MVVTWDSVNKGTNAVLSNNNLTVVIPNNVNTVRATEGKTSGKWYWEIAFSILNNAILGVVRESTNLNTTPYNINGNAFYYSGGNKYPGAIAYGQQYYANDVISVLLDMDLGTIEFWKNGVSQGIAFSDLKNNTSPVYPAITSGSGSMGSTSTARFNINEFTYQPPEGYLAYDGSKIVDNKILLLSNEKSYSISESQKASPYNLSNNIKSVIANGGTSPERTINGIKTGYPNANGWYSSGLPKAWIKYEFNKATVVDRISILSYYDSGYEAIKDFSIEASDNGLFNGEQVVLYQGTHPNETTNTLVDYSFKNKKPYKYYRIDVKNIYYGNGGNNLSIMEVEFRLDNSIVNTIEIPNHSEQNLIKYGIDSPVQVDGTFSNKNYILSTTESINANGLLQTQINRKPLSIKFN